MRALIFILCAAACAALCACAGDGRANSARAEGARGGETFTLGQKKILDIAKLQDELFANPNAALEGEMARAELKTKAVRIISMWKTYFAENPDDVHALLIYGKFLRRIGLDGEAYAAFSKAEKLDPNLAVAKQQMSALEAERGMAREAFAHIRQAMRLEPENTVYMRQCAYILILGKKDLAGGKVVSNAEFDSLAEFCYRKIYESDKSNRAEKVRYAQSFYDLFKPDWQKALSIWREILSESALNLERQTAAANIARVLIELGRDAEAEEALKSVDLPSLARAKRLLLEEIAKRPQK